MKPRLITHSNGLQTLLVPRAGTEAVSVQYFFKVGARYEDATRNGLAHFTEHMVFKGGQRYTTSQEVAAAINRVGGHNNAYTSHQITSFFVKLAADKVAVALDVMSDFLTRPNFAAAELEKERGVIIEEINLYADDPGDQLQELMGRIEYPDHPLGRSVLGTKENIRAFPRDYFVEWVRAHYAPDRCVLAVTGNLSAVTDQLLEEYADRFSGSAPADPDPAPPHQGNPHLEILRKDTEQTHLGISLPAFSFQDRQRTAVFDVLAMILGGNQSSRLFHKIREEQGLCYTIHASPDQLVDDGWLSIYAGVPNDKADHSLAAIMAELRRFLDDLTEEEVEIGRQSLKGGRALRWEESIGLGTFYAIQQLFFGEYESTKQVLRRIDAVTLADVVDLGRELFRDEGLKVGLVGPHKPEKFRKLATVGL